MAENNGGSAFPDFKQTGMTLRDYFAAHAPFTQDDMVEMATAAGEMVTGIQIIQMLVHARYTYADAMIAERAK